VAEGDTVVARLTYTGTHRGELLGYPGTGRKISYGGVAIFHVSGNRIADGWVLGDLTGLMEQLQPAT
jgi:predicted ester cyclase